jgi:hypothetical protein
LTRASPPAASESAEGDDRAKRNAKLQSTVRTQSREAVTQAEARIRGAVAERFLFDLKERLAKFALSLHPEKTRLLEFGRCAAERRRAERSQGKPETFDFLKLAHHCTTRKDGTDFQLGRKTRRKRMKANLRERSRRHYDGSGLRRSTSRDGGFGSARSDLCGLRLGSALKSAVCDDGRGKA